MTLVMSLLYIRRNQRSRKKAPESAFFGCFGDKVSPTSQVLFLRQLVQNGRRLGQRPLRST